MKISFQKCDKVIFPVKIANIILTVISNTVVINDFMSYSQIS